VPGLLPNPSPTLCLPRLSLRPPTFFFPFPLGPFPLLTGTGTRTASLGLTTTGESNPKRSISSEEASDTAEGELRIVVATGRKGWRYCWAGVEWVLEEGMVE
jgi:hypothetical protein